MTDPDEIHGPSSTARQQSNLFAKCSVCGVQWQIRSLAEDSSEAKGCAFCGAPERAITLHSERPDFWHGHIAGGGGRTRSGRDRP